MKQQKQQQQQQQNQQVHNKDLNIDKVEQRRCVDVELQRRAMMIHKYWDQIEQDAVLATKNQDDDKQDSDSSCWYVIPRAIFGDDNGFHIGNVSYLILMWETRWFEQNDVEPHVAVAHHQKKIGDKILDCVFDLEIKSTLYSSGFNEYDLDSPIILRHVNDKILPLVEYWNNKQQVAGSGVEEKQPQAKPATVVAPSPPPPPPQTPPSIENGHHHSMSPLITHMVNLIEGMNDEVKTAKPILTTTRRGARKRNNGHIVVTKRTH